MVTISVPLKSAFDEPIKVTVKNLEAKQSVTVIAQTSRNKGTLTSYANFEADNDGCVDLHNHPALPGGTYEGVEPMGIFWSMQHTGLDKGAMNIVAGVDIHLLRIDIRVVDGHFSSMDEVLSAIENKIISSWPKLLAEIVIDRLFVPDGVKRFKVAHGKMRGALFLPPGSGPFPAVIVINGTTDGLVAYQGGIFARHGFACLCVAYTCYEDLPKNLDCVDFDYFNECYDYLTRHPCIYQQGIGIYADSHGASIAMAFARCQPGIAAVALVNPVSTATRCDFHLRLGERDAGGCEVKTTIPGTKWRMELVKLENGFLDFRPLSSSWVTGDSNGIWQLHSLEIGKVKAPLVFFIGMDDRTMDFNVHLPVIKEQLEKENKTDVEFVVYEKAGHTIRPPYFPITTRAYFPLFKADILFGGVPAEHAKAQVDMWKKTLDFFKRNLIDKPSTPSW